MTVTFPLALPAAEGANFTVNDVFCPAFKVRGKFNPLRLNPLPLTEAAVIVTGDAPVLERVSFKLALLPT